MTVLALQEQLNKGHSFDGAHAFTEGFWIPPEDIGVVAVTNVTYQGNSAGAVAAVGFAEQNALAGLDSLHIIAGATTSAILDITLPFGGLLRTVGTASSVRGASIRDLAIPYSVNAQVLTGVMTVQGLIYGFPAPAVAAAAPLAGATLTATLVASSCPLATNTAGQFQTAQWTLTGGAGATGDYQKVVLRVTIPMTNAGTVDIAGAFLRYQDQ